MLKPTFVEVGEELQLASSHSLLSRVAHGVSLPLLFFLVAISVVSVLLRRNREDVAFPLRHFVMRVENATILLALSR